MVWTSADPVAQQPAPFPMTYLEVCVAALPPETRRAAVHQAVQHLDRGGLLGLSVELDEVLAETIAGLGMTRLLDGTLVDVVVYRRDGRTTVHDLLWEARAMIRRVSLGMLRK